MVSSVLSTENNQTTSTAYEAQGMSSYYPQQQHQQQQQQQQEQEQEQEQERVSSVTLLKQSVSAQLLHNTISSNIRKSIHSNGNQQLSIEGEGEGDKGEGDGEGDDGDIGNVNRSGFGRHDFARNDNSTGGSGSSGYSGMNATSAGVSGMNGSRLKRNENGRTFFQNDAVNDSNEKNGETVNRIRDKDEREHYKEGKGVVEGGENGGDSEDDDGEEDVKGPSSDHITPLPKAAMFVIAIVQFAEAFQITVLFPFVPFMVSDFSEIPRNQIGTFAGILGASFAGGQFLSSYGWGLVSDRLGGKPVVLVSLLLTFSMSLLFGFSVSYPMAVLSRFLCGLFNGNIGVMKSFLGKVTDATNQSKGMAVLSVSWGLGSIIAPALGGLLARPVKNYPSHFDEDGAFGKFPYLLPCLIAAAVVLMCFFATIFLMKEPSEYKRKPLAEDDEANVGKEGKKSKKLFGKKKNFGVEEMELSEWSQSSKFDSRNFSNSNDHSDEDEEDILYQESKAARLEKARNLIGMIRSKVGMDSLKHPGNQHYSKLASDIDTENEAEASSGEKESGLFTVSSSEDSFKQNQSHSDALVNSESPKVSLQISESQLPEAAATVSKVQDMSNALDATAEEEKKTRKLMLLCTFLYGAVAFLFIMIDEIFPLFAAAKINDGGLMFESTDIGIALAVMGAVLLFYTMIPYPKLARKFGNLSLMRWGLVFMIPIFLVFPCINFLSINNYPTWMIWTVLLVNLTLRGICGVHVFTGVMLYVNNSVPRESLGKANGIGQSFAAGLRTVGPALAGVIWSATAHERFPFHQVLPFFAMALIGIAILVLTFRYPDTIVYPYEDRKKIERALAKNQLSKLKLTDRSASAMAGAH